MGPRRLCTALTLALGISSAAFAQALPDTTDNTPAAAQADDIVVTGSRIRRAATESPSPIADCDEATTIRCRSSLSATAIS